ECGEKVDIGIPEGDNRPRHICANCNTIHYLNPKMVVGCLVEHDDKVLLCKRAIEPRYGLWTLPAGFMENNETAMQAATRETMEEAEADVEITQLFTMFSLPHIDQVYMLYRANFKKVAYQAGSESLEVGLFTESEIPWDEIAFPVITESLQRFFADKKAGRFQIHNGAMLKQIKNQQTSFEVIVLDDH
ncbi:FAD pyrophosphatase, partial [hydrothermal vent metagenome]